MKKILTMLAFVIFIVSCSSNSGTKAKINEDNVFTQLEKNKIEEVYSKNKAKYEAQNIKIILFTLNYDTKVEFLVTDGNRLEKKGYIIELTKNNNLYVLTNKNSLKTTSASTLEEILSNLFE